MEGGKTLSFIRMKGLAAWLTPDRKIEGVRHGGDGTFNMGLRLRLEWNCSVDRSRFASAHLRDFFVPGRELCGAIKKMGSIGLSPALPSPRTLERARKGLLLVRNSPIYLNWFTAPIFKLIKGIASLNFKEGLSCPARYEQGRWVGFYPTSRTCSSPLSLRAGTKSINSF